MSGVLLAAQERVEQAERSQSAMLFPQAAQELSKEKPGKARKVWMGENAQIDSPRRILIF